MNCDKMDELLSALVDDELDAREARVVERHLQGCRECRQKAKVLAAMKGAAKRAGRVEAPADLKEALLAQARRRAPAPAPRTAFALPGYRAGFAAAFAAAVAMVAVLASRGPEETIPVDFMLAAHNGYALTQPLAPVDALTPALAERLAADGEAR